VIAGIQATLAKPHVATSKIPQAAIMLIDAAVLMRALLA
jgi:hypothetical protein